MPNTYYVAQGLNGEQVEAALTAINGVISNENNGKVLAIEAGKIVAKSASEWTDTPVLESVTITENGTTTPPTGVDGFNSVTVNVQGGGNAVVQPLSVTQNGTYNPPSGVDGYAPVTVNVSGGGSELIGTDPPTADIGNIGDYYIQETAGGNYLFGITLSVVGRATNYNFTYWGTRDIQIVFDDGNGNEVLLKDLAVKSCLYAVGSSSSFILQNGNIDGSTSSYYEHSGLPGYYLITCEIPRSYLLKALKVWPRSDGSWHDYWRTFTFAQWSAERTQVGNTLLSETDLEYADWPSNEYKVFDLGNATPLPIQGAYLYQKTSTGWIRLK